jgi:hypothetical protein
MPIYPTDPAVQKAVTGIGTDIAAGGPFDAILKVRLAEQEAQREMFATIAKLNPAIASMMLAQNPGILTMLTKTPAVSFGGAPRMVPPTSPIAPGALGNIGQAYEGVSPKAGAKAVKKATTARIDAPTLMGMFQKAAASIPAETRVPLREGQEADIWLKALESADSEKAHTDPAAFQAYLNDYALVATTTDAKARDAAAERIAINPVRKVDVRPIIADARALVEVSKKHPELGSLLGMTGPITNEADAIAALRDSDTRRQIERLQLRLAELAVEKGESLDPAEDRMLAAQLLRAEDELSKVNAQLEAIDPLAKIFQALGAKGQTLPPELAALSQTLGPETRAQLEEQKATLTEEIVRIKGVRKMRGVPEVREEPKAGGARRKTPEEILKEVTGK